MTMMEQIYIQGSPRSAHDINRQVRRSEKNHGFSAMTYAKNKMSSEKPVYRQQNPVMKRVLRNVVAHSLVGVGLFLSLVGIIGIFECLRSFTGTNGL